MVDRAFIKALAEKTPYIVIGNPIAHSLSPKIHTEFAKQTQQDMRYGKLCVEPDDFFETLDLFFASGGLGANITSPFKKMAYEYAAPNCTPEAILSGSVNTLKKVSTIQDTHDFYIPSTLKGEYSWKNVATRTEGSVEGRDARFCNEYSPFKVTSIYIQGHNTDGIGFIRDLEHKNYPIQDKKILILGAGGAALGIIPALLSKKPGCLEIYNRTQEPLNALIHKFPFCDIYQNTENSKIKTPIIPYDLLINTLPSSVFQNMDVLNSTIPIPPHIYSYDLNYNLEDKTPFLEYCSQMNISLCQSDGFGMLKAQAAESFYFWRGVYP